MYRKVMIGSGITATVIAGGYGVALALAGSDHRDAVEVSPRVGAIATTTIMGLALLSGVAWIVKTALRENAGAIAIVVADQVAARIGTSMGEVADRTHARTVAAMREIVTSELIQEELGTAVGKAFRYGMVAEAAGRANVASIRRT